MGEQGKTTKKTTAETLKELREAWQKGVDIGNDLNNTRYVQRAIIADRIKAERNYKGLSQEELADRINANVLTYRGYENCKSDIPTVYLVRIANELDVSLDYLTGRIDKQEVNIDRLEARLHRLEKAVFEQK